MCCFFFFQAEDGIRDLVRSRGLGDVYKRQGLENSTAYGGRGAGEIGFVGALDIEKSRGIDLNPVSYTHLTLPTSDLV